MNMAPNSPKTPNVANTPPVPPTMAAKRLYWLVMTKAELHEAAVATAVAVPRLRSGKISLFNNMGQGPQPMPKAPMYVIKEITATRGGLEAAEEA